MRNGGDGTQVEDGGVGDMARGLGSVQLAERLGMKAWREGPCCHCMALIIIGDFVVPVDPPGSGEVFQSGGEAAAGRVWMHRKCAVSALGGLGEEAHVAESGPEGKDMSNQQKVVMPVCKHWKRNGSCAFGSNCAFDHPPEAAMAARQNSKDAGRRSWQGGGRVQLRASGLPLGAEAEAGLMQAFQAYGEVLEPIVVKEPKKRRGKASSGVGIVRYKTFEQAQAAIEHMHRKVEMCPGEGAIELKLAHLSRKTVRNISRAAVFRRWLIDTFGEKVLKQGSGVLDVAGGKGEISFELVNLSGIPSTVVEPRQLDLKKPCRKFDLGFHSRNHLFAAYNKAAPPGRGGEPAMPKHIKVCFETWGVEAGGVRALQSEEAWREARDRADQMGWEGVAEHEGGEDDDEVEDYYEDDRELEMRGVSVGVGMGGWGNVVEDFEEARRIVNESSIVVGMHPDQAAQAIVDFAAATGKPFACIPCCVFSREPHFRDRTLKSGGNVINYASLVKYLQERHEGTKVATLPFEGKNLVVYHMGEMSKSSNENDED